MYSGTTFRIKSGRVMGVHQKIDRVARRHLTPHISRSLHFPSANDIVRFEGLQGPDGLKRKSPGKDEPWHHINPDDPTDNQLMFIIDDHIHNLTIALSDDNHERASFEASWLAHVVTDGLTPAHHSALKDRIEELFGKPTEERISVIDKNIIRGNNKRDTVLKNWEYWGARGVFTNHFMFEWGVATTVKPLKFEDIALSDDDIDRLATEGFEVLFHEALHTIASLDMYNKFCRQGWTRELAKQTKDILMPIIIKTVCLAWLDAANAAGKDRTHQK